MNYPDSNKPRNRMFVFLLLLLLVSSHLYYRLFSPQMSVWVVILAQALVLLAFIYYAHLSSSKVRNALVKTIKESFSETSFAEELISCAEANSLPEDIIYRMIKYQRKQEEKHQNLLEKLRNNNILLERNSRITDSIMQITSEILSSGEIDEVLQTILDKAIEIIPNAQKGSILLYNGSSLEYRACRGYDFEVLRNLTFQLDEIFQYNSEDFYEPCIISSPESFNKRHLEDDKFEILREGKGFELRSILSCAIQIDNEFYGIINLDSIDEEHTFSKGDKPLIKHLATQIGIALKNARLIEKILFLSKHDSLTGIYNRCHFEEHLMRVYQQYKSSGKVFSLAVLDVNDLKKINDSYGHEAGDLLLKRFTQGIGDSLTREDTFARYGGDEFAIIFVDTGRVQAEAIMKGIQADFAEAPFTYCGNTITTISFGFGIAEFPEDTSTLEELVILADTRMYRNKRKEKKTIQ